MSAREGEGTEMAAGTTADWAMEAIMQWLHTYPPKQRRCCLMDCPLSNLARRGRSAGRLCQLEGFELIMALVLEQSNSLPMTWKKNTKSLSIYQISVWLSTGSSCIALRRWWLGSGDMASNTEGRILKNMWDWLDQWSKKKSHFVDCIQSANLLLLTVCTSYAMSSGVTQTANGGHINWMVLGYPLRLWLTKWWSH